MQIHMQHKNKFTQLLYEQKMQKKGERTRKNLKFSLLLRVTIMVNVELMQILSVKKCHICKQTRCVSTTPKSQIIYIYFLFKKRSDAILPQLLLSCRFYDPCNLCVHSREGVIKLVLWMSQLCATECKSWLRNNKIVSSELLLVIFGARPILHVLCSMCANAVGVYCHWQKNK